MANGDVRRIDVALAAAVAVVGQLESWASLGGHRGASPAGLAVTLLIASGALIWRRQAPLLVVVVVTLALSIDFLAFGAPDGPGNFLPPLMALYAVGRYGAAAEFWVALALTAAGVVVHEGRDPQFHLEGRTTVFWAILVAGGVVGRILQSRARELGATAERAQRVFGQREADVRAAAQEERARIARELHDLVGHGLSLIVLQIVAAQGSLGAGDVDATRQRLDRLEATARNTLAEMRRLVSVSGDDEASLAPQPGIADIDGLVEQVRADGLTVSFHRVGEAADVSAGLSLAVYRLVQEGLTNVIRHAAPAAARVVLACRKDALTVEILDEGRGPIGDLVRGRGLSGMRERVTLYGGTMHAGPRPEGGFGILACFPLDGAPT